jgi:hypothetical protein
MPTIPKTTGDITWGPYTVIQHGLSAGQFGDNQPLDDVAGGGVGPFLVHENGIWKYPEQANAGRVTNAPGKSGGPLFLLSFMADLGANSVWSLHVTNSSNTTGTPYPALDAAKYTEGDITADSGTDRYISKAYNVSQGVDKGFIIMPGQRLYLLTTAAAAGARARFAFSRVNRI